VQELLWALEQPEAAGFTRLALAGLSALAGLVPEEDVRLGYVLAQSARAVRTLGDSASAVQRYTVSEELGRRFNNRLLSTRATLGLGSTQVIHGNYPLARALFGRVLEEKAASAEFKAAARQGLLNAAVASEDWDTALQEGWHLLRAERSGAMAQVEVLNVLAHVCYCVGRYEAAAQAARLALKVATRPYQVMLAISILLNVSSEKRDLSRAREYGRALRLHIGRSAGPFEDARALLALSRFERTCGDASKAVENAAAALRIADRYRYHEISYRAEGILEDLATPTVSVSDGLGASGDQAATADLRTDSLSIIEMLGGLNEQSLQGDTLQLVDL
jgi:tetratricopeptide (TPR) repeat protein